MTLVERLQKEVNELETQLKSRDDFDNIQLSHIIAKLDALWTQLNYLRSIWQPFKINDRVKLAKDWSIRPDVYPHQKHFMHPHNIATVKDYKLYYDYDKDEVTKQTYLIEFDYETYKSEPNGPECQITTKHLYEFEAHQLIS